MEVHIEQGPVLEQLNVSLGVVSAIAGQSRFLVKVTGTQGHAGTVPMAGRRDALAAAAEAINTIERLCQGGPAGKQQNGAFEVRACASAYEQQLGCRFGIRL